MPPITNAEAVKKHHAKLDEIKVRPYREEGARIRQAAERAGESVQGYILEAVRERMSREESET